MKNNEVYLSVRNTGWTFDIVIKTGNVDTRNKLQLALDDLLKVDANKTWTGSIYGWQSHSIEDPYPSQTFQREMLHGASRSFSGEVKEALKLLNAWANGVEKSVGKNNMTVEFSV